MAKEAKATELIPVNVLVAGRSYRIRVAREDEAFVRTAVKRANDQIAELRNHYAGKDDQDFIAMCLLMYATDKTNNTSTEIQEEALTEMIHRIDAAIKDNR